MSDDRVDRRRPPISDERDRRVGAVGAVAAAVPFVASMAPSERAKAAGAPVEVDIGDLKPGQMRTVEWRGKPVYVVHRTEEMLKSLPGLDEVVADPGVEDSIQPEYAHNEYRSQRPEIAVLRRRVHAPGLRAAGEVRYRRRVGTRRRLARRILLPLSRLEVRHRRPGMEERAGAHQPRGAELQLQDDNTIHRRRRSRRRLRSGMMEKLLTWVDDRFPLTQGVERAHGAVLRAQNFNFWYYFGVLSIAGAGDPDRHRASSSPCTTSPTPTSRSHRWSTSCVTCPGAG